MTHKYQTFQHRFKSTPFFPLQNVEVVLPLPGETVPFTGQGFISLSLLQSATFTVEVPQDYRYELIIRYQVSTHLACE